MNWKTRQAWSAQEIKTLRSLARSHTHEEVAVRLERPVRSVLWKAYDIGLVKVPRWTDSETAVLCFLHPHFRNDDIASYLGIPLNRVRAKAQQMKLHKHGVRPPATSAETIGAWVRASVKVSAA